METHVGVVRGFTIKEHGDLFLELMVESRSGKLNPQTGQVMERKVLRDMVNEVIDTKYNNKSLEDIRNLGYLPHTLEILAHRIWDDIEDALDYTAKMSRIKISHGDYFVVYDGRHERSMKRKLQPKPKSKPQPKRQPKTGYRR